MSVYVEAIDSSTGRAAVGLSISILREANGDSAKEVRVRTDESGQVVAAGVITERCRYRLAVDLDEYFAGFGMTPLQSRVEVVFRVFHPQDTVRVLILLTSSSCGAQVQLRRSDEL